MIAKVGKKIAVSKLFGSVTIEIICGDDYEAEVLYDDLVDRLQSGEGITLGVQTTEPAPPAETKEPG